MAATLRRLALLWIALAAMAAFAQDVGRVQYASGLVTVERAGAAQPLRKADAVQRGDVIATGADGLVQLVMVDNAHVSMRPRTRLAIDAYAYDPARPGEGGALLSLFFGVMRTFTGELVRDRKDRVRMKTPLASVGIRGSGNILAHSDETGTINHTLTGAHSVTSIVDGYERTLVSYPGQTIQVLPGRAPRFIPTPPAILAAAAPVSRAASSGGEASAPAASTSASSSSTSSASTSSTSTSTAASSAVAPTSPTSPTNTSGASAALTGPTTTGSTTTTTAQATTTTTGSGLTTTPTARPDYQALLRFYIPVAGGGYAGVFGTLASLDGGTAVLDAAGRLTRLDEVTLGTFISGPGATPPGYADTTTFGTVTINGGQHADGFRSGDGSVVLGRWTGSQVVADDGAGNRTTYDLGPRSLAYMVTALTPSSVLGAFTGTSTYSLAAATAPTDAAGRVGSVTSASMTANFAAQSISGNIALTINGGNYALAGTTGLAPGVPQFAFASSTATLTITCTGTCASASYLGTVNGAFAGPAAQWMGITYRINPDRVGGAAYSDFIVGALALTTPTAPKALRMTQAADVARISRLVPAVALPAGVRPELRRLR